MLTVEPKQNLPTAMLFDEISNFWEEMAEAGPTENQTKFVMDNIEKDGLFLDLCCGNGRHSVQLRKKGYEMVGLDISSRLLRIARLKAAKTNVDLQLVRADMRFLPFKPKIFTAVLSLDASFGYLSSDTEDVQSLSEVWRTVRSKGLFLLDLFNRDRIEHRYKKRFSLNVGIVSLASLFRFPGFFRIFKWKEYPTFFLLQRGKVTKSGNFVEMWFFREKKAKQIVSYQHVIRLYNLSQIMGLFEKACLQIVKTYGHYDGREYTINSNRFIVIAQKIL